MIFEKLDVKKHSLKEVARLIYQTDDVLFPYLFGKNKFIAYARIEKFIIEDNNSFSKNYIYVVTENNNILGIMVAYSGKEVNKINDERLFFKIRSLPEFIKILFSKPLLQLMLTMKFNSDDFYISNISVDENTRGKGVGKLILQEALNLAKEKKCRRAILDVSIENLRAKKLYEETGFKVYNMKTMWLGKDEGTFCLEYVFS